jgi:hypothetical protein
MESSIIVRQFTQCHYNLVKMTSTIKGNGRLCNNIIRNIAVSLIAEKHDLSVEYSYQQEMDTLGLKLFFGTRSYTDTILLTEDNYFQLFESEYLKANLDPNWNFFQRIDTVQLIRNYLNSKSIKESILSKNPFTSRFSSNNDAFIHVRLTDVRDANPGLTYYLKALSMISFDTLYIASDDFEDSIITGIVDVYPNAKLLRVSEVETIQFGSTCKHVVLSHGSFSTVIGLLSYFSEVMYPQHSKKQLWYTRSTFDIPEWRMIDFDLEY